MANSKHVAAKVPAKQAKLIASLAHVSAEERARLGITDDMVKAQLESQRPPKGVHVVRSEWKPDEDADIEPQVRVIDYDNNKVLFSGTDAEYKRLFAAKDDS